MSNRQVDEKGWFQEGRPYDIQRPNAVADIGVPLTPDRRHACGVLLSGRIAEAFSEAELNEMLRGAVYMDADTLRVLWARGLGELTGVKPGESFEASVTEQLTDHALNGHFAGASREATVGPGDDVCSLVPVADGVASAARLVRYDGKDCGSCLSLFTNRLNGRVAVSSYAPWSALGRGSKRQQMLSVLDWLSNGRLPVLIQQTVRVAPFFRMTPDGSRFVMVLMNLALDPTGPLTLWIRTQSRRVALVTPQGETNLPVRASGREIVIEAASIPAWQTATIIGTP